MMYFLPLLKRWGNGSFDMCRFFHSYTFSLFLFGGTVVIDRGYGFIYLIFVNVVRRFTFGVASDFGRQLWINYDVKPSHV